MSSLLSFRTRLHVAAFLIALATGVTSASPASRPTLSLASGWRFQFGDVSGATAPVDVPHSWNTADATEKTLRRGRGWYRLQFTAPAPAAGQRTYLEFRGVSVVATVWLNGMPLGSHDNGFSAFRFDVTDALRRDGDNTLVVLADSTWRDDVPPREGDFSILGGIYRDVVLFTAPTVAIDPLDHGGPGVYLTTPDLATGKGTVAARVALRSSLDHPADVDVGLKIRDANNVVVAEANTHVQAPPGTSEAILSSVVANPVLWQGRRAPYLYHATVTLSGTTGDDAVTEPLGFRTFAIDPERGFILNGQPYDLHGVNLHQDAGNGGWVFHAGERERDFQEMFDLGCTFVRFAHYQHPAIDYDLADRLGLVVWTEHAFVNTAGASPDFAARCAANLRELIRQNYNHPSIVVWGIGNEVQAKKQHAGTILEMLAAEVQVEDPTRPSTLATNYEEPAGAYGVASIAHNQYHGWYHDRPEDFAPWLDRQRAKSPRGAMGVSEYGAGASPKIHTATPVRMDHSEEYQATYHEVCWKALQERPWLWCKTIWVMYDFASSSRHEGDTAGINDKGLVTRDRSSRKDAFYWYQANWSEQPMLHITSRRFTPRQDATTAVKIYSNAATVELEVNGRSLGPRTSSDHLFVWNDVTLTAGKNTLRAHAEIGGRRIADECEWELQTKLITK
jgi:beta-galactosidase